MQQSMKKRMKKGLVRMILIFLVGVALYHIGGIELMVFYILFIVFLVLPTVMNLEKGTNKVVELEKKKEGELMN